MMIAIVEDEPKLANLMQGYLTQAGFDTVVYHDGEQALKSILEAPPALLLLDLMLPGLDGMSVCRELRKTNTELPIIMLTARVEEIDRLLGLEIGADDYICKPYSPREVVARVKAVLRRSQPKTDGADQDESFFLDETKAMVTIHGAHCELTRVELFLLKALHDKPGHILSRDQLMHRIYTDNRIVSDRTIDSHVKKLRQKLHDLHPGAEYVHSVYGIGYKFEKP
ncbi:response regulator [Granulosicoccus antarcticus]|uniref:Transcriptional regulatory protein BaeR n=1 Tax=Granulosicoccus antarcticus IMCC3135 TaxID=1192854 RepID=A0A2Z2NTI4_9GAMM|nr:response regulator [Granulosicoccus antarcticus]ASJ70927.1 Transcriptional regulatory protein BaeR [Granulosicoccus antarcticus IMCC3135]